MKRRTEENKAALLTYLAEGMTITDACKRVGMSKATYYKYMETDEDFAKGINAELSVMVRRVENEHFLACFGRDLPAYKSRESWLRANCPEKYNRPAKMSVEVIECWDDILKRARMPQQPLEKFSKAEPPLLLDAAKPPEVVVGEGEFDERVVSKSKRRKG